MIKPYFKPIIRVIDLWKRYDTDEKDNYALKNHFFLDKFFFN